MQTRDSVIRRIFSEQDDDVHAESRIYYCKSYFTNSVEELVDSIRRQFVASVKDDVGQPTT